METRSTVTTSNNSRSTRTAADSQPIPRSSSSATASTARQPCFSDAHRVVEWLNGSKGTASHDRVVFIHNELETLPREFVANAQAYVHASGGVLEMGEARGKNWPKHKLEIQKQLRDRHVTLNRLLETYIFRPRATYVIARRWWLFGMVPDGNRRWYKLQLGNETVSEADAVLSLVRLSETGDLAKIRLCEMCKQRWCVAARRNYRFCSTQCRENFYCRSVDYHSRKAANQKRYRENLKRRQAAQNSVFRGR